VLGVLYLQPEEFLQKSKVTEPGISVEFSGVGTVSGPTDAAIEHLIAERRAARAARNFKESDRIRDELMKGGIILEDKPDGTTTWRRA